MNATSRPDNFTPPLALPAKVLAYSPPDNPSPSMPVSRSGDIMSRSTNIPQNNDELINLGSHSATSPKATTYGRIAREAGSDGRSDVAAGASGLLARTGEPCRADNQTPAISAAVSKDHSVIPGHSDIGELDVKLDIQSPLGQPSPRADNTEVIPAHNISPSKPSRVATLKGLQVANHEGILNLNRAFSTSPVELSSPLLPAITPPLSQDVQTRKSQGAGNIPFGPPKAAEPGERDQSSTSQADSLGGANVMKPLAQQVDRTASMQPFPIPSTPSVPPLNRRGISISSSISRAASVLTMIAPSRSRRGTARGVEPPSELSHPRDEDKGNAYTNEQRPPSPQGHATATAESPSLPLPVFGPHLWDEIYPLIRGNEGVDREANGTATGPTLDQERQGVTALDECETHAEDSDTISYGAQRRTAGLNPSSDHTPDIIIPKRPPESLVGRMYSFNYSPTYSPNVSHLPETSDPREKLERTLDSAPSLDRTESLITPPEPVLLPMRMQPNDATRCGVPSNDELTSPTVHTPPQPPTVVSDSQAHAVLCPGPPLRSGRSLLEGKGDTHPDISPSTEIHLMQRHVPIITQPTPQECASLHPSSRSSPLGDGQTEPESPGQSGGDGKPEDGRTEDESIQEAERESPPLRKHESQGDVKGLYLRARKKYPCCSCISHVLSFCCSLCSCGPCWD